MALVLKDRVKESSVSTGTGSITLDGATGPFQTFSVVGDGNTTYYGIVGQTTSEWEVGIGTYTASGTTLSRDTILASSASGAAVNFSAGTKDVFCTYPSEKAVYEDLNNKVIPATFDTITSGSIALTTGTISTAPSSSTDIANKAYVDDVAEGLKAKPSAKAATTANLTSTYNNGASGVGATLTATTNGAFPTLDGVTGWAVTTPPQGVLVKNQTNAAENGRYNLTTLGDGSTPWVLTRCSLCDTASEIPGAYTFVTDGTVNGGTGWVQTVADPATFVVGTDAILVVQFSGEGTYTAGTGLTLSGTQFSITNTAVTPASYGTASKTLTATVNAQGQLTALADTDIAIQMSQVTSGVLPVTQGGTGFSSYTVGDIVFANTSTSLAKISDVAVGNALISGGVGTGPSYGKIGLTTHVSGTLPVANGGTGVTTSTGSGNVVLSTSPTLVTPILGTPQSGNFSSGTFTWPTFNQNTTGTAGNVSGVVAIANGGTGETTRQAAMDALAGATTSGQYLRGNGTDVVMANIVAGDVPTLNQNTTGNAGTVTNGVYTTGNQTIGGVKTFTGMPLTVSHPGNQTFGTAIQIRTSGGSDDPVFSLENFNGGSPTRYGISCTDNGSMAFMSGAYENSFGTERMRIANNGDLTLRAGGSANPTHQFFFNENGGEIQLMNAAGGADVLFDSVNGTGRLLTFNGGLVLGPTGSHGISFDTAGVTRMSIASGGAVTVNGNLTASTFIGPLNGNAATATTATTATNQSGGTVNATTGTFSGSITVSTNNVTGGGIILADDGDIVDLNTGYCAMRFSTGVQIFSGNRGGSAVITLGSNGTITAGGDITVGSGQNFSSIIMADNDEGSRLLHCNSNRIGFLNQSGGWGSYCADDGAWGSDARIFTGYDSGVPNSVNCSNWFRSLGDTGWYNASYGGGIWMTDSTWVRVYNNKSFLVNGQVAAAAGPASTPAFTASNDTDTGMFFPAADTIAFSKGGSERMRIHSTGNVSIGTSTAGINDCRLKVSGTMAGGFASTSVLLTNLNFAQLGNVIQKSIGSSQTFAVPLPPEAGAICVLQIVKTTSTNAVITFGGGFLAAGTLSTGTDSTKRFNVIFASNGANLVEIARNGPM